MGCSNSCIEEARFKSRCQPPNKYETHLKKHLETFKKHEFEVFEISLEQSRLQRLKSETFKNIQKIDEVEKLTTCATKSLIKTIEKAHKEFIGRLDCLRKKYFEILEYEKFFTSELPMIEKIETMKLVIKTVEIDQIMDQIEKVYGAELGYHLDKRKVR